MADGQTSATSAALIHHLERTEDLINRAEYGDALGKLTWLKERVANLTLTHKDDQATPAEAAQFHDYDSGRPYEGLPPPKPCPFCGEIRFGGIVETDCGEGADPTACLSYYVECESCLAQGPWAGSPREAAERWNRRPRATAVDDLPRLSDDDREALDSGYVALEGVPATDDVPTDEEIEAGGLVPLSYTFEALRNLVREGHLQSALAMLDEKQESLTMLIRRTRDAIEEARCVAHVINLGLQQQSSDSSRELALVLERYVDEPLYKRTEALGTLLATEVRHG